MYKGNRIVVLDSSAIINGYDPSSTMLRHFISSKAAEEIKDYNSKAKIQRAVEIGKLTVKTAKYEFIEEVKKAALETGDLHYLSEADIETLAIALECVRKGMKVVILTDDYSIQNVANHLQIETRSVMMKGISKKIIWIRYCPSCGATYGVENIDECRICGSKLKRKPKA